MDLMLPKQVSGFDLVCEIRQVPELTSLPIVDLSASDPDTAMLCARQLGFSGFICKPISPVLTS
jgi:CheY-like chemotaxis protein